ncbi:MAG TPA: MBL fold metallo-hydrolase [Desulfomonilaceae bacterium]|nr:MBL fold metallo-hydrolase [Desulfomonilaceae bacterium]
MKIAEHLYIYLWGDPRENNCNSIFIDGKTPLLIDPGHGHRVNDLFGRMREDGVDPERIRMIVCTHAHPDHFSGTAAFHGSHQKIAISREEEKYIEDIGRPMYVQQGIQMPDYRVDFYLREGDLVVGKHELQVLLTPGHSPGSICIFWPRYKILFSGDVVFAQGVGRADLPGGNAAALKQSVKRLSELPVEIIVPGHGPVIQGSAQVRSNFEFVTRALANVR